MSIKKLVHTCLPLLLSIGCAAETGMETGSHQNQQERNLMIVPINAPQCGLDEEAKLFVSLRQKQRPDDQPFTVNELTYEAFHGEKVIASGASLAHADSQAFDRESFYHWIMSVDDPAIANNAQSLRITIPSEAMNSADQVRGSLEWRVYKACKSAHSPSGVDSTAHTFTLNACSGEVSAFLNFGATQQSAFETAWVDGYAVDEQGARDYFDRNLVESGPKGSTYQIHFGPLEYGGAFHGLSSVRQIVLRPAAFPKDSERSEANRAAFQEIWSQVLRYCNYEEFRPF